MKRLEIFTSKKKSFKLIFLSLLFLVVGIWFVLVPESIHLGILTARIVGISMIILAIATTFLSIKQIIKPKLVLVIDTRGLALNPNKSPNEYVGWADIHSFDEQSLNKQKILIINVKNTEKWMRKETNGLRKKLMSFTLERYGSPFSIYSDSWDIDYDTLKEILNDYLQKSNS